MVTDNIYTPISDCPEAAEPRRWDVYTECDIMPEIPFHPEDVRIFNFTCKGFPIRFTSYNPYFTKSLVKDIVKEVYRQIPTWFTDNKESVIRHCLYTPSGKMRVYEFEIVKKVK